MTTNQVERPIGRVAYTPMVNQRGGVVSDITVTRLADERYLV